MKEYSEKLLGNVERITMNENLKELQRNWIGKSQGMQVTFDIVDGDNNKLTTADIFTTCIETIYGITFMVMAPEHKLLDELMNNIMEDMDPFPYDLSDAELLNEVKCSLGIKPYPEN